MISFALLSSKKRPAFRLPIERQALCLIDTCALISVWCMPVFWLLKCYPDAEKTNFYTTVSGFGGKSLKKREVWRIPEFPKYNRPVFCVPDGYVDVDAFDQYLPQKTMSDEGENDCFSEALKAQFQ